MEILIIITILFYMASTASYVAYLFAQKDCLYRSGAYILILGFFCHTAAIAFGFVKSGNLPVYRLYEILSLAGWTIAGVFLVSQYKLRLKILGIYAVPLVTLVMIISSQLPREAPQIKNIFSNFWIIFHVVIIFIGESFFALACGVGILYLIQENSIKNKNHGFFFRRLPSLELLDSTGYTCIISGFAMLTLGLITGFLYAKLIWGRLWSWDPKEVWSGITWLLYAALLHGRFALGWRGRKAAIISVIGFVVLLFTFLGVNFLLEGHHGEFIRW